MNTNDNVITLPATAAQRLLPHAQRLADAVAGGSAHRVAHAIGPVAEIVDAEQLAPALGIDEQHDLLDAIVDWVDRLDSYATHCERQRRPADHVVARRFGIAFS